MDGVGEVLGIENWLGKEFEEMFVGVSVCRR